MSENQYNPDHTQASNVYSQSSSQRPRRVVKRHAGSAAASQGTYGREQSGYSPVDQTSGYGYGTSQNPDSTSVYSAQRAAEQRGSYGYGQGRAAQGQTGSVGYSGYTQPGQGQAAVAQQPAEPKKKKEQAVSMPVAIGSALSAVTSLFLSSHIGIGGSVVTVAVGAIASSVMSQAYTHIVSKSAEKMKSLGSGSSKQQIDGVMDSSQLGSYSLGEDGTEVAATGTPIASDELHNAAAKRSGSSAKRKGIIITVIVALAMVLATAGIITFATQGSGIGTKTTPIIATTTTTPEDTTTTDESTVPEKDGEDTTDSTTTDKTDSDSTTDSSKSATTTEGTTSRGSTTSDSDSTNSSSTNSSSRESNSSSSTSGTSGSSTSGTSGTSSNTGTSSSTSGSGTNSGTSSSTSGTGSNSGTSTSGNSGSSSSKSSTGSSTSSTGSSSTGTGSSATTSSAAE